MLGKLAEQRIVRSLAGIVSHRAIVGQVLNLLNRMLDACPLLCCNRAQELSNRRLPMTPQEVQVLQRKQLGGESQRQKFEHGQFITPEPGLGERVFAGFRVTLDPDTGLAEVLNITQNRSG